MVQAVRKKRLSSKENKTRKKELDETETSNHCQRLRRVAHGAYPNERQPEGGVKTCVELYREFRKNPESFFALGPAE